MSTFGTIKTKIENTTVKLYNTPKFKTFMSEFKTHILENKDMSEIFYIYDDLSTNKGLNESIVDDYINESVEYLQILIESNTKKIKSIDSWLSKYTKTTNNNYKEIDTTVYEKSIRSLSFVLESKNLIKKTLKTEPKKVQVKESINLPLSSMMKVAKTTFDKKYENLPDTDKEVLKSLMSLSKEEITENIKSLKEEVSSKLTKTLNESADSEMKETINKTIQKINDSKTDVYNLYKLQELNKGL